MVQLGTCGDWRVWNEDYRTAICFNEKAQGNCTLQVKIKKETEFLPQTLIFESLYLCNKILKPFVISNTDFC